MMAAFRAGDLELARVSASVQGWVNHGRDGNTVGLRQAVLGHVDRGRDAQDTPR
jgi:hypothetical protein